MSISYSKQIPTDRNTVPLQEFPPAFPAIKTDLSENNSVSSIITLVANATNLEVGAAGSGAVIRWLPVGVAEASVYSAPATANYDHFIPANTYRKFVIPVESQGKSSVVGLNYQAGLYARIAVKSVGAASVLTTQY